MSPAEDAAHMALALALSGRGAATCRPNPAVGCVLVRDGIVVGRGWHERAGGPHAEVRALADAGAERARGATAYVTLEPCDHTGRTGPCSRALLDAGVARVVLARRDPVEGHDGGAARLRTAGVVVDELAMAGFEDAAAERFLTRARTGRPWVTLKLAATRAGATVAVDGRWITGPAARTRVHAQRARANAVLVGVGTVLADDPRLDVRHVRPTLGQPVPVVLDGTARTPPDAVVVGRGALVVTGPHADAGRVAALTAAGARVEPVGLDASGRLDLTAALAVLASTGIAEVYAEPGVTLGTALVAAGLVDELVVHRPRVAGDGPDRWPAPWDAGRWEHVRSCVLGDDREDVFRPAPRHR